MLRAAERRPRVHTLLTELHLAEHDADRAVLGGRAVVCKAAEHSLKAIEEVFQEALGRGVRVELRPEERAAEGSAAAAPSRGSPGPEPAPARPAMRIDDEDVANHPLVREAMELLEAKIVRVEPRMDRPA